MNLQNVVVITDQMETIPLIADTTYIVNNNTNTHVVFGFVKDYKIGDQIRIEGKMGPQSCSWMLEFQAKPPVTVKFDDLDATELIIGTDTDNLFMECINTNPLVFRATSDKGRLQINEAAGMKG